MSFPSYTLSLPPSVFSTAPFISFFFHLTYSYFPLGIPPSLLVDCNKTLAVQFMFAPLAPSPAQPQLLPVVHGGGSLPSANGIYSWNYTHRVFQLDPTSTIPLSSTMSGGSGEGGLNYKSSHPVRTEMRGYSGARTQSSLCVLYICCIAWTLDVPRGKMIGDLIMRTVLKILDIKTAVQPWALNGCHSAEHLQGFMPWQSRALLNHSLPICGFLGDNPRVEVKR